MVTRLLACFCASLCLAASLLATPSAMAQERVITLASTTSTENSGLLRDILPRFTAQTGIAVRVVAVGTGAALNLGQQGDADVVLVHARAAEDAFVAAGYGAYRRDVMFNDFIIVGPGTDPAETRSAKTAPDALARIARAGTSFVSRGDDSGTHKAERRLWAASEVTPDGASDSWYKETGSGMGATLNTTASLNGYTLSDRGTWLSFANRGNLDIVFEGDPRLFNPYGIILVNPERHPHIHAEDAQRLIDWMTGPTGQAAIAAFKISDEQLFFPNADR